MCETLPIDLDNCGKGGIQSAVGIIMVWARSKANVFVGMQMRRVVVALSAAVAVLLQLGHGWAFHIAVPMRMSAGRSVQVCTNTACKKAGSRGILDVFRAFAPEGVHVMESGCQGKCGLGPNIRTTTPKEEVYQGVLKPATAAAIIELDFMTPVPDAVVDGFNRIVGGDAFYDRTLHAQALDIYSECLSSGAFEGSSHALSVVKLKQSQAMRMLAQKAKRSGKGSSSGGKPVVSFEEAQVAAREAIEHWRTNAPAWLHLSDVLADTGDIEEAFDALDTLSREVPDAKGDASEKKAEIRNR